MQCSAGPQNPTAGLQQPETAKRLHGMRRRSGVVSAGHSLVGGPTRRLYRPLVAGQWGWAGLMDVSQLHFWLQHSILALCNCFATQLGLICADSGQFIKVLCTESFAVLEAGGRHSMASSTFSVTIITMTAWLACHDAD